MVTSKPSSTNYPRTSLKSAIRLVLHSKNVRHKSIRSLYSSGIIKTTTIMVAIAQVFTSSHSEQRS